VNLEETTDTNIYTDGSAFSNPSRGGFAVVIVQGAHQQRISGGFLNMTSIRIELMAAVVALERLTAPCRVRLVTDCKVLQRAVEEDYPQRCESMAWTNPGNVPLRNRDLWRRLQVCLEQHEVKLVCIASRSPDLFVRFVRREARRSAQREGLRIDPGFVSRTDTTRGYLALNTKSRAFYGTDFRTN
jgi:ribonuclease HI